MKHNREKRYYEYLAKMVLETFISTDFAEITLQEQPDLLNFDGRGIEVTRAMFYGDGESTGLFRRVRGKTIEEANPRDIERYEQLNTELLYYNGRIEGMCPEAQWCTIKELQNAFIKKIGKLGMYVSNVSLFIFAPSFDWYEREMIQEFTEWAIEKQQGLSHAYTHAFVFQSTGLFICDLIDNSVELISTDKEIVRRCCENALVYAG